MTSKIKRWDPEQIKQMNEESFLVEMLDMFQYTPDLDDSDSAVKEMREHMARVEEILRTRLEVSKS